MISAIDRKEHVLLEGDAKDMQWLIPGRTFKVRTVSRYLKEDTQRDTVSAVLSWKKMQDSKDVIILLSS